MDIKKRQQQGYSVCTQPHTETQGGTPPLDPPKRAIPQPDFQRRRQRRGSTREVHERRDRTFKFRLTSWEVARLEAKARSAGIKPSEYLRASAGLSKGQGNSEDLALIAAIAQANQWLSLLAERISAKGPALDVAVAINLLRQIRKFLKRLLEWRKGQSC